MHTTQVYAALLAIFFVVLSVRVVSLRRKLHVTLGAGGNPTLERAIRVHGNFAEYVPLGLLLIFLVESKAAPVWLPHLLGLCLVAGRTSHALGVSQEKEDIRFRIVGMALTFTSLLVAAVYLLFTYLTADM